MGASVAASISASAGIGLAISYSDWGIYWAGGIKGKERIAHHLGRMLGATIATLTAFIVTNFSFEPAFVLWLAPTALITPLIFWWTKQVMNGRQVLFD